jgi:glycosyltransferase involved in cell wall biosynthesis
MLLQDYFNTEVIVVNYSSPDGLSEWLSQNYSNQLLSGKLIEVTVPKVYYFDHSHSRNVGLRSAHGEWVFFIDADCKPAPILVSHLLSRISDLPNVFSIVGTPAFGAAGSLFANRQDLIDLGGYMEDLSGWGYEDGDIRDRLFLNDKEMFSFSPKFLPSLKNSSLEICMYFAPPMNRAHENNNWQQDMYNRNYNLSKKYIEENGIVANKGREWGKGGINIVKPISANNSNQGTLKAFCMNYDNNGNLLNLDELLKNGCPQDYINKAITMMKNKDAYKETVVLSHDKLRLTQIQEKKVDIKEDKSEIVEVPDEN